MKFVITIDIIIQTNLAPGIQIGQALALTKFILLIMLKCQQLLAF